MVSHVVTDKSEYDCDLIILCIGFVPNNSLVKGKLKKLENGAIVIDEYMRTFQPHFNEPWNLLNITALQGIK